MTCAKIDKLMVNTYNSNMKLRLYVLMMFIVVIFLSCAGIPDKNKGDLFLELSAPNIHSILIVPENEETKITNTFWGTGIGLDYYHSENQFINLGALGAFSLLDFPIPIPAAVGPSNSGEDETIISLYTSLSNNHIVKRFVIGYGLTYARNIWTYRNYNKDEQINKISDSLGFYFPFYFQINRLFNVGIIYRPTFFRPMLDDKFKYEHLVNLYFSMKIHLNKNRQNK